jgi:hypothetical protein
MAGMSSTSPAPGVGVRRRSRPRIICAVIWAAVAIVCGIGGVLELTISNLGGAIVSFLVAVLSGWYVYRVWTFRARLLVLVLGSVREGPPR